GATIVILYVSNLALPMGPEKRLALEELVAAFKDEPLARASLWMMSNEAFGHEELSVDSVSTVWTSPFEKAFEDLVKAYDLQRFPVRSSLHGSSDRIDLASTGTVGGTDVLFKFCSATPVVRLMQGDTR